MWARAGRGRSPAWPGAHARRHRELLKVEEVQRPITAAREQMHVIDSDARHAARVQLVPAALYPVYDDPAVAPVTLVGDVW